MNGLNDVTIMGTVGQDAIVNQLDGGKAVANFSIAINDSYMPKNGADRVQTTEWVKIEAWNSLATFSSNYIRKGMNLLIKGKLKTDTYTKDVAGQQTTFYSTKIVADKILFTENKSKNEAAPAQTAPAQTAPAQTASAESFVNTKEGDDLPF